MPTYRCVVTNASGQRKSILRNAETDEEAARSFSTGDWFLVSLSEVSTDTIRTTRTRRYSHETIQEFTDLTSMLLSSGLTLKDALEMEKGIVGAGQLARLVTDLLEPIQKGESFVSAMRSCGESFPPMYRGMISVGDTVGSVEKMFPRLSEYLSQRKKIRDHIVGALTYPIFVLVLAAGGLLGISFFLLPRLYEIFQQIGGDTAQKLQTNARGIAATLRWSSIGLAALLVGIPVSLRIRATTVPFARFVDGAILRIPGIGTVMKSYETMNFAFAMEILVSAGIPLERALEEASAVIGNTAYREAVIAIKDAIMKGDSLSRACSGRNELPRYVTHWVAAGERSGHTRAVFAQIRIYFQADVDRMSDRAMSLVEPVLIVLVGGIVLWLVMSFIVPLFSLYGSVLQ